MSPIDPETWGPSLWRAVHFVALGYPASPSEADVAAYRSFFTGLDKVIPCGSCAENYRRHLLELPIEPFLYGGEGRLFEWTVQLHNIVDKELKKPRHDWTAAQAREALLAPTRTPSAPAQQTQQQAHPSVSAGTSTSNSNNVAKPPPPESPYAIQRQQGYSSSSSLAATVFAILAVLVAVMAFVTAAWLVSRRIPA